MARTQRQIAHDLRANVEAITADLADLATLAVPLAGAHAAAFTAELSAVTFSLMRIADMMKRLVGG